MKSNMAHKLVFAVLLVALLFSCAMAARMVIATEQGFDQRRFLRRCSRPTICCGHNGNVNDPTNCEFCC
ncbi:unnamed protein product [Linum tenue]|uniref:Uncharacterized protein n=1 Tax=Linum tenue TaxID=586396 RepID=A0AAV0IIQ1_9ROSI|nr:unnamed protein product [Linum tenue]